MLSPVNIPLAALSRARKQAVFAFAFLGLAALLPAASFNYYIAGDDPGPWPQILSAIGLTRAVGGPANLIVVR